MASSHWMSYAGSSSSDEDGVCYLAPLGEEDMIQMYKVKDGNVDVFKTNDGVGCSLKWDHTKRKVYLYLTSTEHYSLWQGICLIEDGEMDYESLDDIQDAFGLTRSHPFWVLPGSKLQQLRQDDPAPENQE